MAQNNGKFLQIDVKVAFFNEDFEEKAYQNNPRIIWERAREQGSKIKKSLSRNIIKY